MKFCYMFLLFFMLNIVCFSQNLEKDLLATCLKGDLKAVNKILEKNPDVNKEYNGDLPLITSISAESETSFDIVKALIEAGADVNKKDNSLNFPLGEAARTSGEITAYLLTKGADPNEKDMIGNTPLHRALMFLNKDATIALLASKADPNAVDNQGVTPIIMMIATDDTEFFKIFTDAQVDLSKPTGKEGFTPIEYAMKMKNKTIFNEMLNLNINLNEKNAMGSHALETAIIMEDMDAIEYFLSHDFDINSSINSDGDTALIISTYLGKKDLLKYFIDKKANVNIRNSNGNTALFEAVFNPELTNILLEAGADPNIKNNQLLSPLAFAVSINRESVIKPLVEKGAHIDTMDQKMRTILNIAYEVGDDAVISFLEATKANFKESELISMVKENKIDEVNNLISGGNFYVDSKDSMGCSSIFYAKNSSMIDLLVSSGADIKICNNDGRTPMHMAAFLGNIETLEAFFNKGLNINEIDYAGFTPLHLASAKNNLDCVEFLIKNGANIEAKNNLGDTSLISASLNGAKDTIRYLINEKAFINEQNNNGQTPLYAAVISQMSEAVDTLISLGADLNLTDNAGNTPLMTACEYKEETIIEALLNAGSDPNILNKMNRYCLLDALDKKLSANIIDKLIKVTKDLNQEDRAGIRPIYYSVIHSRVDILNMLISAGAKPYNIGNNNLLHYVYVYSDPETYRNLTEILIKSGVDINKRGDMGSPLLMACAKGSYEGVETLLNAGADANGTALTSLDFLPLLFCIKSEKSDIASLLIDKGAVTDIRLPNDVTLIMLGAKYLDKIALENLLAKGGDIKAKNRTNFTAMHYGVYNKETKDILELLIEKGGEINIKAEDQITPLYNAIALNKPDIVEYLIKSGADTKAKTSGIDYLAQAKEFNYPEIISVFEGKEAIKKADMEINPRFHFKIIVNSISDLQTAVKVGTKIDDTVMNCKNTLFYDEENESLTIDMVTSYNIGRVMDKVNRLEERNSFRLAVEQRNKDNLVVKFNKL